MGAGKTGVKKSKKRTQQPLTVKKKEKRERVVKKKQHKWSKKHATVFLSVGEHVPESVAEPTVTPVAGERAGELCRYTAAASSFFWPESSQGSVYLHEDLRAAGEISISFATLQFVIAR